jgi:uncharacterized protein YhbP (UPF0306 family)
MNAQEKTAHIHQFISNQTVASICCTNSIGELHCFSCYYAFDTKAGLLYFKTGDQNQHMLWMQQQPQIAGTILPAKLNKLQVKGIQLNGTLLPVGDVATKDASKRYHLKYPFALAMPGTVQTIRIHQLKMTDSSLGFGTKLIWERVSEMVELD